MNEKKDKPLVNELYLLQKYPGKGGWTYAVISEISPDKRAHFGWVRVRGFIDDFELKSYRLMPLGNGQLFLPVRAEIRKKIGKSAGDTVHVVLFHDNDPLEIPGEFLSCLRDEPTAHKIFLNYSESDQKAFIDWIYGSKKSETRVERIVKAIEMIREKQKLRDKHPGESRYLQRQQTTCTFGNRSRPVLERCFTGEHFILPIKQKSKHFSG